jgi:nucleotide-binding universal stress UspA family protein
VAAASAKAALETAARSLRMPLVETVAAAGLPSARFIDDMGQVSRVIIRHARLADLVVTAELAKNPPALAAFESVLMGARRPVLIASQARRAAAGGTVVIAWNGSTESAYAVASALPLLKSAASITVISAELDSADMPPPTAVVSYLALHGIAAKAASLDIKGKSVGPALIESAAALGADLIVMGGYGHSRLREFIMGGVTRHMLTHATTAVLMAH